ncbi:MAG TPA: hypothetical protein VLA04_05010 [Verrucomicrobiae bacterium]|nr:hypothetical protein [Verrucomicrobiae bacterium]
MYKFASLTIVAALAFILTGCSDSDFAPPPSPMLGLTAAIDEKVKQAEPEGLVAGPALQTLYTAGAYQPRPDQQIDLLVRQKEGSTPKTLLLEIVDRHGRIVLQHRISLHRHESSTRQLAEEAVEEFILGYRRPPDMDPASPKKP